MLGSSSCFESEHDHYTSMEQCIGSRNGLLSEFLTMGLRTRRRTALRLIKGERRARSVLGEL
jgi:hypothetical protein